jgi:phospholipase D1/2
VVCNDMEVLISDIAPEGRGVLTKPKRTKSHHPQSLVEREDAEVKLLPPTPTGRESHSEEPLTSQLPPLPPSNADYHTSPRQKPGQCPPPDLKQAFIDQDCMKDPVNDAFYFDTWQTVAENNTKIFRTVFRCNPDSEVKSWKEYKEYTAYGERFAELQNYPAATPHVRPVSNPHSGPPGASTIPVPAALGVSKRDSSSMEEDTAVDTSGTHQKVSTKDETRSSQDEKSALKALESHTSNTAQNGASNPAIQSHEKGAEKERSSSQFVGYSDTLNVNASSQQQKARRRTNTRSSKREFNASDAIIDKRHAEELLNMVQGRLVLWPYDWLVFLESDIYHLSQRNSAGLKRKNRAAIGSTLLIKYLQ